MNEYNIDELIDKPLNELTEDEAEFVINWKAEIATREREYQERLALLDEECRERSTIARNLANAATQQLNDLYNNAMRLYNGE